MTTTPLSTDNAMQLASEAFALWLRDQRQPRRRQLRFHRDERQRRRTRRVAQVRDYADPLRMAQVIEQTRRS